MKSKLRICGGMFGLALVVICGLPKPGVAASLTSPEQSEEAASVPNGQQVYERHCAACHGLTGDGQEPAAVWLYPKPRDFSAGLFKIKSTPGQSLPTDADLLRSVTRGLPGSAMPGFAYLVEPERRAVVEYVKSLTVRVEDSGRRVNRFEEAAANGKLLPPVEVPPETPNTVQELVLGREVFRKMECALCHGEAGAGDGPQVPTLKDEAGVPIRPRGFPTFNWVDGGAISPDIAADVLAEFPSWTKEQGLCGRCFETYEVAAARQPVVL